MGAIFYVSKSLVSLFLVFIKSKEQSFWKERKAIIVTFGENEMK